MMEEDKEQLYASDSDRLSTGDSMVAYSINNENRFESHSGSASLASAITTNSIESSRVPVYAYGATALSASGRASAVVLNEFDPFPVDIACPNCQQIIQTKITHKVGRLAIVTCGIIGVLTCGLGCVMVLFCKPLLDVHHSCPSCGNTVGMYRRKMCCS